MNDALNVVGASVDRLDAVEKVTGRARYIADIFRHGMLYAVALRSPLAHARIKSIDTAAAEALDGVHAVLTHENVPTRMFGEVGIVDCPILPDRVRHWGDEVVVVAAESEEIGRQAVSLIRVDYEELPPLLTVDDALAPGAPLIPPPETSETNLLSSPERSGRLDIGDVETGLRDADRIFEGLYRTAAICHLPIEPRGCLAEWQDGKLTVWSTTQKPFPDRHQLARVLGLPETDVRVIAPYLGGGFGGKSGGRMAMLTALLAQRAGRPVTWRFGREEDMLARTRPATTVEARVGAREDGHLTAIEVRLVAAAGGYNWVLRTGLDGVFSLFRADNYRYDVNMVYTNHPPGGQWRGVLNGPVSFALNQLMDRAAADLGYHSPMDLIRQVHVRGGDEAGLETDGRVFPVSSCGLDQCLDEGAAMIDWEINWQGWRKPVAVHGARRIGLGMSPLVQETGTGIQASSALVRVNWDGTVELMTPVTEIGQGAKTTQAQVLAQTMGVPLDRITVVHSDTGITPVDSSGQVASSTAVIRSQATKLAGEDARRQVLWRAADKFNADSESLDLAAGKIYVKDDPERSITLEELMSDSPLGLEPVLGKGSTSYDKWPAKAFNYGAHYALVEVDTDTGKVRVLKYVAAHDLGRALNPAIVRGQIHGGVAMGLSMTLSEGLVFDDRGRPRNLASSDYKIFGPADCPAEIIPIIIEASDPMTPYGAKGCGEAAQTGVAPCIANAIYNATGLRFTELPITAERVRQAWRQADTGSDTP